MNRTAPPYRAGAISRALDTPHPANALAGAEPRRRSASIRTARADVRNPQLGLRAAEQIRTLPPEARCALAALLHDLSLDSRERAERSWRQNKAPRAAYWKAVSVYAGQAKPHTRRLYG